MEETKFIWMDGKLIPWHEAKIHVLTHSLHYGSAVFEGIRFYETPKGPAIFRLNDHIERLFNSANAFDMKIPFTKNEIEQATIELLKMNELKSGYIRPLVYFGYGKMGLSLPGAPVNVMIAAWPWGKYLGEKAIKVKTSSFLRIHPQSSVMSAKISGHYANSILAGEEARKSGFDEALLLDYQGNIAEGPGENFFIIKGDTIFTPRTGSILSGITRDSIIKIVQDLGYRIREIPMTKKDIEEADEAFFTGTAAELTPIAQIDSKHLKSTKITEKIKQVYLDAVQGKNSKYEDWLTYLN